MPSLGTQRVVLVLFQQEVGIIYVINCMFTIEYTFPLRLYLQNGQSTIYTSSIVKLPLTK